MPRWGLRAISLIAALTSVSVLSATSAAAAWHQHGTSMKPRQQWNANFGYCGETSFIAAGMRHGQYTSQWTARRLASPGIPQWRRDAQLLLGVNDRVAAKRMRLRVTRFDNHGQRSARRFLAWSKRRFVHGDDVIAGVFNNVRKLGEPPSLADSDYDHIVPVMGWGSATAYERNLGYRSTDVITFSDNGLSSVGRNTPFLFSYELGNFPKSRREASSVSGPLYSLKRRPPNYGIAVEGVADADRVLAPIRLTSSADGEGRQNAAKLKAPPAPRMIRLTAHAQLPRRRQAYDIYLYDRFSAVPRRDFNAHADRAIASWHVPAGHARTWRTTIEALSSETRVFRAVPAGAS
jgi:hypothetical protein